MSLFKHFAIVSILWVNSLTSLHAETIGTASPTVINSYDGYAGLVYIFNGTPKFATAGNAVSFDFAGDTLGKSVTPLLFEKPDDTTYVIKGVGASITSAGGTGVQTASFNLLAGSASVSAGYTFGYYDGLVSSDGGGGVVTDSVNAGVITTIVDGGPWVFASTPAPYTNINPGTVWVIGSGNGQTLDPGDGTPGNPFHLVGDGRTYQINITSDGVVSVQPGDFDGDGDVDGADFVAWQTHFPTAMNATLADGDADADGDVDGADFVVWQTNFPFTPSPAVAAVPEPLSLTLLLMAGGAIVLSRRSRLARSRGTSRNS